MGGRKAMPQEKKNTLNIYTIPKNIQDKKLLKTNVSRDTVYRILREFKSNPKHCIT